MLDTKRNNMSDIAVEQELSGKIVGYCENFKNSTSLVKALIQVGTKVIGVNIGFLQYEYISHDNPIGSTVKISFHDGEWFMENSKVSDRIGLRAGAHALKALSHAAGTFKGMSDPASEEKLPGTTEVDADLNFILNTVGTIDMGIEVSDDYNIEQIEARYLSETNCMLEKIEMPGLRMVPNRKRLAQAIN
jgi:hypothetical protein